MAETSSTLNMESDECMGPAKTSAGGDSSAVGLQMEADGSESSSHSSTPSRKSDECLGQGETFTRGDYSAGHVQQGASGAQSKRTDETEDSAHRWTPEEAEIHEKLRSTLKSKFEQLVEGVPNQGDPRLLQEIYTDLYVTEGGGGGVNYEHEVRQIERASWRRVAQDRPIKCSDIFKRLLEEERRFLEEERKKEPLHKQHRPIRTVLTKGVAGIGKTVSVQKFILDWAEGTTNQEVHFIFPLPFRELNLMKEKKLSLVELIQVFFPEVNDPRILTSSEHRVMFIFDGLDECRLPLDFRSNPRCCDATEPVSVDVLLTNLIKGDLLPSALLWITTRPAAANQIPPKFVYQVTEIRGFNDPQKDEYFRKRISDENLASRTVTHLKSTRSLYILCHIPVFCWITATVVERTSESEKVKMPRTLTQMYTHFLIVQTSIKQKYTERKETDEEVIFQLGKLAFQQLEKGNLIFYEEDLRECGTDVTEASVYSGVCTQIFREEAGLCHGRVFSFVHLSIQEFLAALYVFLCFSNRQRNIPDQQQTSQLSALFTATTLHDLHKTAVDLALQSKNGHLDLFLRFLLGLSLESNQSLLKHLLPQSSSQSDSSEQTVQYIKQKIRDQHDSNRSINLFYCLNELNHHAVVELIDKSSGTLSVVMLLPGQWETKTWKTFKLSEEQLDEFDLQKHIKTPEEDQTELLSPEEVLQKVLPAVTSALLVDCKLTEKSCSYLASALTSLSSTLRLLDLTSNDLQDSGVELLCSALSHQNCKLEELQLQGCDLTEKSCSYLASALTSLSSTLRLLDLTSNDLQDSGVELLCSALSHQNCKLEELRLDSCNLTEKSCSYLASALTSLSSTLRLLHLSSNDLQDSGVELLCSALSHQNCKLEELRLDSCNLTEKSCSYLASALTSLSSTLRLLHLSTNPLQDSGVELLCSALSHQNCKLEELQLRFCNLTEKSCSYLASALTSLSSTLRLLHLSTNHLQDSGVELLCSALSHQNCKLEELQLRHCNLTEKSCSYLASALTSLSSTLRLLDLSNTVFGFDNVLSASAVEELSALVKDPHCKLEELTVGDWGDVRTIRKERPAAAAAAAAAASTSSSHSSDAAELHLRDKAQQHPGAQLLSLDTHKQGAKVVPRRSCESCTEVPDSSHWVLVKPEVSTEESVSTYSLSSPAGSYECSESGLRWTCAGPVTLRYRFIQDELFWAQLQELRYQPAGPLMDIKLLSGQLEEVHLPHSLCLGGFDPAVLGGAVRALHSDDSDSGVSLEMCQLSRFHGRLPAPCFSLWQLVVSLGIPVKSHCEVLIYQSCPRPLVLHTYLLPAPSTARQEVQQRWRSQEKLISKPPPDDSFWVNTRFQLCVSSSITPPEITPPEITPPEITPSVMKLSYKTPPTFFEVCLRNPSGDFNMELRTADTSQPVWSAVLRKGADYPRTREQADPGETSDSHAASAPSRHPDPGQDFFSKHKGALETRLPVLASILIPLQQRGVLNDLEREQVESKPTSTERNHVLLTIIQKRGTTAQLEFYKVLKEVDPGLVNDLEGTS
ncbi:NACHT, LRR and PYD domains-containing protein 3-like isoform X4 [Sardina pilchardus]|uniref:NACHT, LRR and PYD domains-containing protein 3-like isoform X4 n=1 Tax=Sardina pilchardus TaxID=27697 RepID=UPI002E0ED98D